MKKLLMASIVLTIFTASIVTFQISSCKKANAQTTTKFPIQGLWIGSYTYDAQPGLGQQYFSFAIKPDGTIITDTKSGNQQYLAIGTWSLTGDSLACSYTYIYGPAPGAGTSQITNAKWDNSGKLTGTWQNTLPDNGVTGTITLTRIN